MSRILRTWVAALLLGALGFAQASIALAACAMERGSIAAVLAPESSDPCDCGPAMTEFGPLYSNRCLAHCTSDLQLSGAAPVIVAAGAQVSASILLRPVPPMALPRWGSPPPAAAVPKRIQLHSFLV